MGSESCETRTLRAGARIAYTMLALFRSVTQRSDERRATPSQTLMTDLFVAMITTTELELRAPKTLRLH